MDRVRFRKWEILSDAAATRAAYDELEIGWPEYCGCVHCRNFVRARPGAYPEDARRFFETLGVDPGREQEVVPYRAVGPDAYQYSGSFAFVGELASGPDFWRRSPGGGLVSDPEGLEPLTDRFGLGFTRELSRTPRPFRGKTAAQIEFTATVPWLLDRRMPDAPRGRRIR